MSEINLPTDSGDYDLLFVFDDVMGYPHDLIHDDLLKNNFELVESGPEFRKKSYIKKA